jgi:uncharacterized repeat protein (TIGR03803 family)
MTLGLCIAFALGGCGRVGTIGALPGTGSIQTQPMVSSGSGYRVLYRFLGVSKGDAAIPLVNLFAFGGVLYGTSDEGGRVCRGFQKGCGTIFSYDSAGHENVLHVFAGGKFDGQFPSSPLIAANGLLYGVTTLGGLGTSCQSGCGTLFSFNPSSRNIAVVYSFKGLGDGAQPSGKLVLAGGKIYGTALAGGSKRKCGTIFSFDPTTGVEQTVYKFPGNNGAEPSGLSLWGGVLAGTTRYTLSGRRGWGVVFSYDPKTQTEKTMYALKGTPDSAYPRAALAVVKGVAYGTSESGGADNLGTVFAVWLASGKERILYSFPGAGHGALPFGPVIVLNGYIYGTASAGGTGTCSFYKQSGCGALFKLDARTRSETILHAFQGGADGSLPIAGLTSANGLLYGVAAQTWPGPTYSGAGTIFALKP